VVPLPAEYFGHVPLMVGSFVGVVLLESVIPPLLEPLVELLVVPPELPPELLVPPPPLELEPPPLELELPPLELLPPVLLEVLPELLEPLEPLELVCPLEELVFRPTSEPLLLPETVLLVIGAGVLLPTELPETGPVESVVVEPVPVAQPGAHAVPQSKTKRQGDSVRSNRFTATP
jgi:hypothetical protein